jgi:hypothetical protein
MLRQFQDMGPEAVCEWLDSCDMPPAFQTDAREWLGERAKQEEQRKGAIEAGQINIARSTKDEPIVVKLPKRSRTSTGR